MSRICKAILHSDTALVGVLFCELLELPTLRRSFRKKRLGFLKRNAVPNGELLTTQTLINTHINVANKRITAVKSVYYAEFQTTAWPCDGRDEVCRLGRPE